MGSNHVLIGILVGCSPVKSNNALAMTGATRGTTGSPMPVGDSSLSNYFYIYFGHMLNLRRPILMKVPLHNLTLININFSKQSSHHSKYNTTLNLSLNSTGVNFTKPQSTATFIFSITGLLSRSETSQLIAT